MSDEDVMELSLADDEGGEEEGLELSLAGEEGGEAAETNETSVSMPSDGGWSITLKNPTIKIEKLVVKREE